MLLQRVASFRLLIVPMALVLAAGAVACGGDDGGGGTSPTRAAATTPAGVQAATNRTNDGAAKPTLAMPASRFAISVDDVGKTYLTDLARSAKLTAEAFGGTSYFASATEGKKLLEEWGYLGGYRSGFEPEGRNKAVLNGAFYFETEVHLFKSEDGAAKAYAQVLAKLNASQSEPATAPAVGNQSAAWSLIFSRVPESPIEAVYHRMLFQRGNAMVMVQTFGAAPLMTVDPVAALAGAVDDKLLGARPAVEPTPLPVTAR